jgi:hypothetical protein
MTLVPELFVRRLNKPKGLPINVRDVSVTGDGQTDDYAALNEAVRSAGATGTLYFPAGTYVVGTNLTIPACCIFAFGAKLKPSSGITVTLSGPVETAPGESVIATGTAGTVSITGTLESGNGVIDVRAFGAVADGVTNNTALIQAVIAGLGTSRTILLFVPPGVRFDYTAVIETLNASPNIAIMDWSGVSSYNTGGFQSKVFGLLSGDVTANDTSWSVQSGHHAVLEFNNYGSSEDSPGVPTPSGAKRAMSIFYDVGEYQGEPNSGNNAYKVAAQLLWGKSANGDFWAWDLRKYAPWLAVAAGWERWRSGVAASSGVTYVLASNGSFYVAASTGTTGNTEPSWGSGTQSDGGVDWTFVEDLDTSVFSVDETGRLLLNGGRSTTALMSLVQSPVDSASEALVELAPTGDTKTSALRMYLTNGAGTRIAVPFFRANTSGALAVRSSVDDATLLDMSDSGGVAVNEFRFGFTLNSAADGDTTPSVSGLATLYVSNTGATSITALDDGSNDQVVRIIATNGNTTLVNSGAFALSGSANVTLTTNSTITLQMKHASISSGWVEVSRSIV